MTSSVVFVLFDLTKTTVSLNTYHAEDCIEPAPLPTPARLLLIASYVDHLQAPTGCAPVEGSSFTHIQKFTSLVAIIAILSEPATFSKSRNPKKYCF
jgi:hypothetical protein